MWQLMVMVDTALGMADMTSGFGMMHFRGNQFSLLQFDKETKYTRQFI